MVERAATATRPHERGVGGRDVVGLLSYNGADFLTTIVAVNHLGAVAMPINWAASVR
jgi:acyl-CoA synthetase (AMP-forming)/AMP-acid ligase II